MYPSTLSVVIRPFASQSLVLSGITARASIPLVQNLPQVSTIPSYTWYLLPWQINSSCAIYKTSKLSFCVSLLAHEEVIGGGDSIGGTPSEGVDVASSSFPSVKNQGLIEPVGLWNQQRGVPVNNVWCLTVDERGPIHTQTITLPRTTGRLPIFPVGWKQSG